jgi:hypothetical protein
MMVVQEQIYHWKNFPMYPTYNMKAWCYETLLNYKLKRGDDVPLNLIIMKFNTHQLISFQEYFHALYVYDSYNGNDVIMTNN